MTSQPIRSAVIGFGTSGRVFHAPYLHADPRFSLDFVVTGNPERRQLASESHPGARVCGDADELFTHAESIDLIVVGTPPDTHADLARRAIGAGIAVVIDKPFCPTLAEGTQLVEDAAAAGVPLTVYQNRRWDADFLTLLGLVESGRLGEVRRFESRFERWQPQVAKDWKRENGPQLGGGVLFDLGSHLIDQALQLFGPVVDVHAEVSAHRTPGSDDDAFVALRHESGVHSHLWMNTMAAQAGPRFRVLGSEAAYTKWGMDQQEKRVAAGMRPDDPDYGLEPESTWGVLGVDGAADRVPALRGRYDAFYAGLADALLEGAPVPVDPCESLATLAIIEEIHRRWPLDRD